MINNLIGLKVDKNRHCPDGGKPVVFDKSCQRFYDITREDVETDKSPEEYDEQQGELTGDDNAPF